MKKSMGVYMELNGEQSKRIQVLRGVAIIAVVFIHNTPDGIMQVFCRPFLNFAVGLFLFLSGLLSSASNWNPRKRIIKVLIPYLVWTLIYSIINRISQPTEIPIAFIKGVLSGNAAAIMYYIFVYCEFTLLVPLIDKLAKSQFKYIGFLITPFEILLIRVLPIVLGIELNKYVNMMVTISCLGWFTYFYLGYLLGNRIIVVKTDSKFIYLFWFISLMIQFVEGYIYYSIGNEDCGTQLKLSAIITGVLVAILSYNYIIDGKKRDLSVLHFLGNESFGIYFSHLAVMEILNSIPMYANYIGYPLTAIFALIFTVVFVLLCKRILGRFSKYLAI